MLAGRTSGCAAAGLKAVRSPSTETATGVFGATFTGRPGGWGPCPAARSSPPPGKLTNPGGARCGQGHPDHAPRRAVGRTRVEVVQDLAHVGTATTHGQSAVLGQAHAMAPSTAFDHQLTAHRVGTRGRSRQGQDRGGQDRKGGKSVRVAPAGRRTHLSVLHSGDPVSRASTSRTCPASNRSMNPRRTCGAKGALGTRQERDGPVVGGSRVARRRSSALRHCTFIRTPRGVYVRPLPCTPIVSPRATRRRTR